ncbi:MAG: site-specific DNA-methyltransferase, partial [Candidatus Spechtbacterales bacterium]
MANKKNYKGSLRLDWINKDLSLYYEIDEKEGKGVRPVWVPKNDIRVAEPRILRFVKDFGDKTSGNMLIKGDNLLVLRSLVEMFKGKPEKEKVKCIYIDPPFNTGNAFKHYDDNLQHSEWLTLMRDRLFLLRKLLRKDGIMWVHLDDEEVHYCKVIIDEVFGRKNFVTSIAVKSSTPSGVKTAHREKKIIKQKDIILVYKKTEAANFNPVYVTRDNWDAHYSLFLIKKGRNYILKNLVDILLKEKILEKKVTVKDLDINSTKFKSFYLKNANQICRLQSHKNEAATKFSRKKENVVVSFPSKDGKSSNLYYNGQVITPLAQSIQSVLINREKKKDLGMLLCDFWQDIDFQNTQNEGGIDFPTAKKPEALLYRIIEMSSSDGDIVLDSFLGSGTTIAVSNKMKRRWIGIEMGGHATTHCIPRLQNVINGKDNSGVTKICNWTSGGGFKYYQLGESIIHEQDMNWALKAEEMAEAVFLHFQYRPTEAEWLKKENMYLGRHQSARYHFALSFASREVKTLTADLYEKIVAELEKEKFKHLTIFTNVAVSVPPVLHRRKRLKIMARYNI